MRYAHYEIKKPQIKNKTKALLPSMPVQVMYVREASSPKGVEAIEWFLMTHEEAGSYQAAYELVG